MSRGSERTVIAGAGLVGSLLAVFLARRGKTVEVVERRPGSSRKEQISAGRSINLAISVAGTARAARRWGWSRRRSPTPSPCRGG